MAAKKNDIFREKKIIAMFHLLWFCFKQIKLVQTSSTIIYIFSSFQKRITSGGTGHEIVINEGQIKNGGHTQYIKKLTLA